MLNRCYSITFFFPQFIVGSIIFLETTYLSYRLLEKPFKIKEFQLSFSLILSLLLFSVFGMILIFFTKIYFICDTYLIYSILSIGLLIPTIFMTNFDEIYKKLTVNFQFKEFLKSNATILLFSLICILLFVIFAINYPSRVALANAQNPAYTATSFQELQVASLIPIYVWVLLIIEIGLMIWECFQKQLSKVFIELLIYIFIFSLCGIVYTGGWAGYDTNTISSIVNNVMNITPTLFNADEINYLIFYYSSFLYEVGMYFLANIGTIATFVLIFSPIIKIESYIIFFAVLYYILKDRKNNFLISIIAILYATSPIQLKFVHIINSESLGTIAVLLCILLFFARNEKQHVNFNLAIFLIAIYASYHYPHVFIVLPLLYLSFIYDFSKKREKSKVPSP